MPLSDRIRRLAEKFTDRQATDPSPPPLPQGTQPEDLAQDNVPDNSVALAPAWSTGDPQTLLGTRVAANSYSIKQQLVSESVGKGAMPTNAWWENLIVEEGDQPVVTAPYMVKCIDGAVVVCAPTALTQPNYVASVWHDDWRLELAGSQHKVMAYDPLSVTVEYSGNCSAVVPLVKGAAFFSAIFKSSTKVCLTTVHAILNVDTSRVSEGVSVVELNSGAVWLVCCQGGVAMQQSGMSTLVSEAGVCGVVRLALVPDGSQQAIEALVQARDAVPVGGSISAQTMDDRAEFEIQWQQRGSGDLLMCALPHHQHSLIDAQWAHGVGNFWSSKGQLRAIYGQRWRWAEEIEPLGFAGQTELTEVHCEKLRELVAADSESLPAELSQLPPDPYFFGKALARATRIALIADEVGEAASRDLAVQRAKSWFEFWLNGTNSNPLLYDIEWRGLISRAGLTDPAADFGQGRYNDHHFHYGYFVYAAAVLAKLDPEWVVPRRDMLDIFVRDYCNPTSSDSAFPIVRSFDFFEGHSWAAGLFAFADSRNQESTSEAINAYYAAFLYAQITGRPELARFSRALLQLEARTSRTYWHLGDLTSDIYPEVYAKDKAVVGILWSSKADYTTFFGENPEFIYGIQMLPYTPASALLLKRQWIEEIWPKYLHAVADGSKTESWREIICLAYAVADRDKTLEMLGSISEHDDGNSASNSYYWAATAP